MVEPVFKWPGAKTWMTRLAIDVGTHVSGRVIEPFAGSASFFIQSMVDCAILGDVNPEVVACLAGLRDSPDRIIELLQTLKNEREYFDKLKFIAFQNNAERAARMIFLLNTCWGGIYRENLAGRFNVPFGNNNRKFYCETKIFNFSNRLKNSQIYCQDYATTLDACSQEDLIFVDPPYVAPETRHFDRYHSKKFTWQDQCKLASILIKKDTGNLLAIVAGCESAALKAMYPRWATANISRNKSLTAAIGNRGLRAEVLLFSPALMETLRLRTSELDGYVTYRLH